MPTFLQLAQEVHKLSQVQGTLSSVLESGINGEIAALVSRSWVDIQNLRQNFTFMRRNKTFPLVVSTYSYALDSAGLFPIAATDDFGRWREEPASVFMTHPTTLAVTELRFVDYDSLMQRIATAGVQPDSTPTVWTFNPANDAFVVYPKPDVIYSITAIYYRTPQVLAATADVPHIRSTWHDIIVSRAVAKFLAGKGRQGLQQTYEVMYAQRVGDLLRRFCPAEVATIVPVA